MAKPIAAVGLGQLGHTPTCRESARAGLNETGGRKARPPGMLRSDWETAQGQVAPPFELAAVESPEAHIWNVPVAPAS